MTLKIALKINPDYQNLVPPLTDAEYQSLKESIKTEGQQLPIIVNSEMEILDGHHRNKACLELGVEPDFEVKHFEDKIDEKIFVVESNLRRRQLNALDAVALSLKDEELHAEKAKQRQYNANPDGINQYSTKEDLCSFEQKSKVEPIHAREIAATKAGVSETTFHRAKTILQKATPELIQKVRNYDESISSAYKQVQRQEHNTIPLKLQIPKTAENLPQELYPTNIWTLPNDRPQGYGSEDFRGNCDPTIIDQCLRRYLMPFTPEMQILDPMAGSGTFIDVAKCVGFQSKQIIAYDLTPRREDIQQQDTLNLSLDKNKVNLVFCHYPYWDMWKYSEDNRDLSNCDYAEFLSRVEKSFKEYERVLKPEGYLCILIGNKRVNGVIDIEADLSLIGQKIFGSLWDKIITIVGNAATHASSAHGNWGLVSARALKNKWTVQNYDTLLIFRKETNN